MAVEWHCKALKRHGGSTGTIITTVNRIAVFSWSHVLVLKEMKGDPRPIYVN